MKTSSAVCAQIPIKKCNKITKGIRLIVFWLNAASAGILTEYLKMIYFLQKNEIIKYTVVIGIIMGIKEEYMTEMKKFKQTMAFYVAKSNSLLAKSLFAYFWIIGDSLTFSHALFTLHFVKQSNKQVTTKLIMGLTIAMIKKLI